MFNEFSTNNKLPLLPRALFYFCDTGRNLEQTVVDILKFSLAVRRREHKQNWHVYSLLLFVSSRPHNQAESKVNDWAGVRWPTTGTRQKKVGESTFSKVKKKIVSLVGMWRFLHSIVYSYVMWTTTRWFRSNFAVFINFKWWRVET